MESTLNIAIFGEAGSGPFGIPHYIQSVTEFEQAMGQLSDGKGFELAIQSLMHKRHLYYIRVAEEGFSLKDYEMGFESLMTRNLPTSLAAVALPGVGDEKIIDKCLPLLNLHKSILLMSEEDFYDFMTGINPSS
ncbi:MAG: hypothetical protein S4CHLAM102_06160 [Chlamydiia bacterium]|nr:hypothetical protein [Chlamydiia bacterium]